jgi:hypothetical protein
LDRASVFGTGAQSIQTTDNNQLTNPENADTPESTLTGIELPSELMEIIEQWDVLPSHVKETIKMLVETAKKNSGVS